MILEPLPVEKIVAGLPDAIANLKPDNWFNAAEAIMTTDTQPKAASRTVTIGGHTVTMTGISKGAGMIKPNMATMLGYLAFDAKVAQPVLDQLVRHAADQSFNCITIDGDTSTNDSFMLIATGAGSLASDSTSIRPNTPRCATPSPTLSRNLAQQIIRDGEGATKFMTITVEEGASVEECRKIAYSIAHSPLVKTAFFASDPNLGRILAAIGYAGVDDLDVTQAQHVPGRRLGRQERRPQSGLPGSRRPARHEAERDHGARHAGARRRQRHRVDLRPVARLRHHQRRLPLVSRMTPLEQFLLRAEALLQRVEAVLPPAIPREPDWKRSFAFRWRKRASGGASYLQPVVHVSTIALDDLHNIGAQKQQIEQNTRQFVQGRPANNVLLTGARGTGKSSLIKACLNQFAADGLRLIEVDKADLAELADIVDLVAGRPERFVIFCDDLSFEEGESGYKALKVALDGGISAQSDNVLIYATSNRRHLMPERMSDNAELHARRRRRPASGRDGGREDLAVGALRPVAVVLSVQAGRLSGHRRRTGWPASAATRSRSRRRAPRRCAGPCSAARARAAWRGSSPRTMQESCPQ